MAINENNIIDIDDAALVENTPMVLINQDGKQLAIPLMSSGNFDTTSLNGNWLDIAESELLPNTPVVAINKNGKTYVLPIATGIPEVINPADRVPLTFTAQEAGSTVALEFNGTEPLIYYRSSKNIGWLAYADSQVIKLDNINDYVQFWNKSDSLSTSNTTVNFAMTGKLAASGSIQSMLNWSEVLQKACFNRLFLDCTALTTAPELPATELKFDCYSHMFSGCTSLTTAPELPATELEPYCYQWMFAGCTSLTTAPELPATTLSTSCYAYMFANCSLIDYIKVNFTEWEYDKASTLYWLNDVALTGTFKKPSTLPVLRGDHYIPEGWTVVDI